MTFFCLGIRLDGNYMEVPCKERDYCPYYTNVNLGVALSHPDEYQELETYNTKECKYFNKEWRTKTIFETSETQTSGLPTR